MAKPLATERHPSTKHPDPHRRSSPSPLTSIKNFFKRLGPGLVTGASDDDPSGIITYSQAGAQFGYQLLWLMLFSYPLMAAIQRISARIGRVTGHGVAGLLAHRCPRYILYGLVLLLIAANSINIGADLAGMGECAKLLFHGSQKLYVVFFAFGSAAVEIFVPYRSYVKYMKGLTLVLFAYVAAAFFAPVDWRAVCIGTFIPHLPMTREALFALTAVLGTTISPYLFFWRASEEVEEIEIMPRAKPLRNAPRQAGRHLHRIEVDTFSGMAMSNIVGWFVVLTTAATVHRQGSAMINSAAQAAQALTPLAGRWAELLFALGILGTGLLAIPVLAGSTAYAVAETAQWRGSLEDKPLDDKAFYGVLALVTLGGMGINLFSVSPMKALYASAVINAVVAVPLMVAMMILSADKQLMGRFALSASLKFWGWAATVAMALTSITLLFPAHP